MTHGDPFVARVGTYAVYAGFWRRFWAVVLDLLIILFVAWAVSSVTHGNAASQLNWAFTLVYWVGLTAQGGTIGKRMLSLRVVRADGSDLGLLRAFLREPVGKTISAIPLMLGFVWAVWDRRRQAFHDKIVDSVVVRELPALAAPEWAAHPPWERTADGDVAATRAEPPLPPPSMPVSHPPGGSAPTAEPPRGRDEPRGPEWGAGGPSSDW